MIAINPSFVVMMAYKVVGKIPTKPFSKCLSYRFAVSTSRSKPVFYQIMEKDSAKTVLNEEIPETGTTNFGDTAFATKRLRLANKGTSKSNIAIYIDCVLALSPSMLDATVAVK